MLWSESFLKPLKNLMFYRMYIKNPQRVVFYVKKTPPRLLNRVWIANDWDTSKIQHPAQISGSIAKASFRNCN